MSSADSIRARLREARTGEIEIELRFSIPDVSLQRAFIHVCRRYGVTPYRAPRQQQTGLSVRARARSSSACSRDLRRRDPDGSETHADLGR